MALYRPALLLVHPASRPALYARRRQRMTVAVPKHFSDSIRQRRLVALALLSGTFFGVAALHEHAFAFAGYVLILYIGIILTTFRLPLYYRLTTRGIYLTTEPAALGAPLCVALNFWVLWLFDQVTQVQLTHYERQPALLIRTRLGERGTILPIDRADVDRAARYFESLADGAHMNAFS
jgi:hypothetical protein